MVIVTYILGGDAACYRNVPERVNLKTGRIPNPVERHVVDARRIDHDTPIVSVGDVEVGAVPGQRRRRLKRVGAIRIESRVTAELIGLPENHVGTRSARRGNSVVNQNSVVTAIRDEKSACHRRSPETRERKGGGAFAAGQVRKLSLSVPLTAQSTVVPPSGLLSASSVALVTV